MDFSEDVCWRLVWAGDLRDRIQHGTVARAQTGTAGGFAGLMSMSTAPTIRPEPVQLFDFVSCSLSSQNLCLRRDGESYECFAVEGSDSDTAVREGKFITSFPFTCPFDRSHSLSMFLELALDGMAEDADVRVGIAAVDFGKAALFSVKDSRIYVNGEPQPQPYVVPTEQVIKTVGVRVFGKEWDMKWILNSKEGPSWSAIGSLPRDHDFHLAIWTNR